MAAIETVVGEMRARGLAVNLEITGGAAQGTTEPGLVPGPVVAAIAHATREALANVAEHAGIGRAWVAVSVTAPGEPGTVPRIEAVRAQSPGKYAQANRAAPTKVDLYHRALEDGHLPSPPTEADRYDQAVEDGHLPSPP